MINDCFLLVFCRMIMSVLGRKVKDLMTVSLPPLPYCVVGGSPWMPFYIFISMYILSCEAVCRSFFNNSHSLLSGNCQTPCFAFDGPLKSSAASTQASSWPVRKSPPVVLHHSLDVDLPALHTVQWHMKSAKCSHEWIGPKLCLFWKWKQTLLSKKASLHFSPYCSYY